MKTEYDVIVIGGGAAGMMSAISASESGASVLIIEKNKRLGEKLSITGGGRCNITNAEYNLRALLHNFGDSEKYLYSAFTAFGVKETISFFENLGLPIKVEAKNRAFPVSEKASDVIHVMVNRLDKNNVDIVKNSPVSEIKTKDGLIESVVCGEMEFKAKQYILATGGISRPETGSTGDGFSWLEALGHTMRAPSPNITPLAVLETGLVQSVAGKSASGASVAFSCHNAQKLKIKGDILFTHFGISGLIILNNAYKVAELLEEDTVFCHIDLYPGKNPKELDQIIINALNSNGTKLLKNVLSLFVPAGLTPLIKETLKDKLDFETKSSEVSRDSRKLLVDCLKNITLTIEKLMGFERAVVADGGIALDELDMRTFQSKKVANLCVTGDLLDINRPSGGYSLQLCWTSGYIAGTNSAENSKK